MLEVQVVWPVPHVQSAPRRVRGGQAEGRDRGLREQERGCYKLRGACAHRAGWHVAIPRGRRQLRGVRCCICAKKMRLERGRLERGRLVWEGVLREVALRGGGGLCEYPPPCIFPTEPLISAEPHSYRILTSNLQPPIPNPPTPPSSDSNLRLQPLTPAVLPT